MACSVGIRPLAWPFLRIVITKETVVEVYFKKKKNIDTKIGRLSTFFPSRLTRSCLRITSFRELAPSHSHSRSLSRSFFHSLASFSFHPRFCHFIFHSRLSYLLIYWWLSSASVAKNRFLLSTRRQFLFLWYCFFFFSVHFAFFVFGILYLVYIVLLRANPTVRPSVPFIQLPVIHQSRIVPFLCTTHS